MAECDRKFIYLRSGYSLFELIVVIVIIALIAAAGLKYYMDIRDEAVRTGLVTQARNFAAVIQGARAQWLSGDHPDIAPTQPGMKLAVNLDGNRVFVNERGWPANTSIELDSSSNSQTAAECYELWFALMNNPQAATVQGAPGVGGKKGQQRYHISAIEGVCRFEIVSRPYAGSYFDYHLKTGKVLTNVLENE